MPLAAESTQPVQGVPAGGISAAGMAAPRGLQSRGQPPRPPPSSPRGRRAGGRSVDVHCRAVGRSSVGKAFVLFRPDLDPLPPLPLGSAPGTRGMSLLLVLLVILPLLVQVLHQLLDGDIGGRGTDFLIPLGSKHDSTQHASRLGSLEAVGLDPAAGDGFPAVLQAAVRS